MYLNTGRRQLLLRKKDWERDLPHSGDLTLEFGPDIMDNRFYGYSYDPLCVIVKLHKEADVEAAAG